MLWYARVRILFFTERRPIGPVRGLYLVQRALGHRHITTTEIYARVGEEALRRAVGEI